MSNKHALTHADLVPDLTVPEAHQGKINEIRVSPNGKRVVTAGCDGWVHVWELHLDDAAAPLRKLPQESFQPSQAPTEIERNARIALWRDDRTLLSAGWDGFVEARSLSKRETLWSWPSARQKKVPVNDLSLSHDGAWLAVATNTGIAVLNSKTGKRRAWLKRADEVSALDFSPIGDEDGEYRIAFGDVWGEVRQWRIAPGGKGEVEDFVKDSHQGQTVDLVRFDPRGNGLVSCGRDGRVVFWEPRQRERKHTLSLYPAIHRDPEDETNGCFSADGRLSLWINQNHHVGWLYEDLNEATKRRVPGIYRACFHPGGEWLIVSGGPDEDSLGVLELSKDDQEMIVQYVTRDQIASLMKRHKDTIADWFNEDENSPNPAVEGGGGKAHEYNWSEVLPWLQQKSGRILPQHFPSPFPSA